MRVVLMVSWCSGVDGYAIPSCCVSRLVPPQPIGSNTPKPADLLALSHVSHLTHPSSKNDRHRSGKALKKVYTAMPFW